MFLKIKLFILSIYINIINTYNNFFNVKEIYSLNNNNNKIIKSEYSLFYFRLLYLLYYLQFYLLFNILYYFNQFKNELYVLVINKNNIPYKLFIDNKNNDSIYFILNYKSLFILNDDLDMKILKCKCFTSDETNKFFDININNYYIKNYYQSLHNIFYDLNINKSKNNYIQLLQIDLYDILLNENIKSYDTVYLNYNISIVDSLKIN